MKTNQAKEQTVDGVTTLTLLDGVAGCNEIDLPVGRLVRVEGDDASLFVVEAEDDCAGCALDPDVFDDLPFPCKAFACCEYRRRDETNVILRRVEGSDDAANESEARRQ
ncbi:MAG: hypothetical protein J6K20_02150 [Thermoguttaceae bacterium]|nr:hypothetical protein [Thermoguttaceae bacterium]